jgi:predicted transporter
MALMIQEYRRQKATMETWSNTLEVFALLLTAAAEAFVVAAAIYCWRTWKKKKMDCDYR